MDFMPWDVAWSPGGIYSPCHTVTTFLAQLNQNLDNKFLQP